MLYCLVMAAAARRPKDDVWSPDAFDATAVELMRNLINRAKQPGHLYPMAMFSYPVMPPPKTVDKALGERRLTAWSGVGISVCEELDWQAVIKGEQQGRGHRTLAVRYAALLVVQHMQTLPAFTAWQAAGPGRCVLMCLLSYAEAATCTSCIAMTLLLLLLQTPVHHEMTEFCSLE
jgi:hypothetical protein